MVCPTPIPNGALTHWGVDDVPAALAAALEQGATVHTPAFYVDAGIVTATVRTPHDTVVGCSRNPHFAGGPMSTLGPRWTGSPDYDSAEYR